jgi:hypothetical protein
MNSLIIGEVPHTIVAAFVGTDITKSYFIIGIRKSLDTNSLYTGGVSRYEIYDNKAFFNDSLGWDFENSAVWEMREYDELPMLKGTGTDYIRITNAEELYNIGFSDATLRSNYVLMNDIDLSTFNGGVWMPIGSQSPFSASSNDFRGTLHGNNKKILNFRMNNGDPIGLFYRPNGGSVRHLIIEDFHFTYVDGGTTAAAPLANNGGLNVRNVHATGVIDYASDATAGFIYAAGLITSNTGNTTGSSISDSSFRGTIRIREGAASATVAGLMTSSSSNRGSVSTSKSSGTIEIQNSAATSTVLISSVAGIAQMSTVRSSYSDMDITVSSTGPASTSSKFQIGGIIADGSDTAQLTGTLYNYFAGSINLSSDYTYNYAGGIIGAGAWATIKANLVLTDRITVDDDTRNNYGRVVGKKYYSAFYSNRTTDAEDCYVIDTLPNGVDKDTGYPSGTSASTANVVNGDDLLNPVDSAFLESLDWDMSLWKPVTAGTLPKLAWEE